MNKIQDVVADYENITSDEKAHVPDTNYEFAKQVVPGRPEHRLTNAIKDAQTKN